MLTARLRFACLWLSQGARIAADWSLRLFVILWLIKSKGGTISSAWHLVTAVAIAPFILLSPFNGALSNGLPKRRVLVGSAAYCLAIVALFHGLDGYWLVGIGLAALGMAVYCPVRFAILPAAAADMGMPLTRVNALIEMGGAAAIVVGVILGQLPAALNLSLVCAACSVLAAVPASFRSDVCRPEPVGQAVAGFFRDARRIVGDPLARGTLLGLACFLAMVTAGSGVLLSTALEQQVNSEEQILVTNLLLVTAGVALGSLLAGLQGHIRRGLGLVPLGAAGMLAALAWAAAAADKTWPCFFLGLTVGPVSVPLRAAYQDAVPPDTRGNGMAVSYLVNYVLTALLAVVLVGLVSLGALPTLTAQLWFLAALAGMGVALASWMLLRETIEQATEIVLWPIHRISGRGPGLAKFPMRGPVVIVANHSAWFDPLWVGKVIPRRLYPMMTSLFFDLPGLHFLMTRIVHAIRVPAVNFRREAPELRDAIAVLDRGECLLIFPEGMLRRKEATYIRQFGQGIWHILHERPETPVVVCWIEGGWGSMTSYWKGPPLKNKKTDWWHPVRIGVSEPRLLDRGLLEDMTATRAYLMRACLEARGLLGLEVHAALDPPPSADEESPVDEEKAG